MKKIYVVIQILRQMGGEGASALMDYVGVKMHKSFVDKDKAQAYANKLVNNKEEKVDAPEGPIKCLVCETGVQPVELVE
jgi:hypothetical protein